MHRGRGRLPLPPLSRGGRQDAHGKRSHRSKGADGLTDKTVTGPNGKTATTDRYRGSDGVVDKTVTGPKGGVSTVDRSRNADGTVDKTVTTTRP